MKEKKYALNLQLFAEEDDEEIILEDEDPEGLGEAVDTGTEEFQGEDGDLEDDDFPDEEDDKKTKALIKYKKEAAALRRKLEELENQQEQKALELETKARTTELTAQGKTPEEATKIAADEAETKMLKIQLAKLELEKLEIKYPGIRSYAKQLLEDKQKLPEFSFEQLYRAKYMQQSQYDSRTQLEQELLFKNQQARSKSLEAGNQKPQQQVKLSAEDERLYRYLKQSMPDMTRKRFKELQESDSLE